MSVAAAYLCRSAAPSAAEERVRSGVRLVVGVAAVANVEDMDDVGGFVDAVHDPVSSAPGAVAAGQRAEQWLAAAVRIDGKRGVAEFEYGCGNGLGQPLGDGPPGCGLEADVVPLLRRDGHLPVARRLARSWRTVARSAPGSPRPSAVRLSEMRATTSLSPRISRVISRPSRSSTETRTASGSPLRVRVIRSCCWRTRLASSDRRALASDSGTGVAAIVIVRTIAYLGHFSGQQAGK